MTLLLAGLALVTLAAVAWLLLKPGAQRRPAASTPLARTALPPAAVASRPLAQTPSAGAPPAPRAPPAPPAPPALPAAAPVFEMRPASSLNAEQQATLLKTFANVPRPPRLLQHLLSPEFVNAATSIKLVELISAEPLISAKVLATVNSPLYGLKSEVAGIGQAVTYLGLNTVRNLCLQYILVSAFKADSAERQQLLDHTWRASAMAAELAHQLAHRLALPEPGSVVSAVVLSFLGRLATAAQMPAPQLARVPSRSLLERATAEQQELGLTASEIGRLLMGAWQLPERVLADAADIDTLLVTPREALDATRSPRLALGYLCARLGERFAAGELRDLLVFDATSTQDAELFHLQSHWSDARLARLADYLRAPMLNGDVQRMLAAWRY